MAFTFRYRVRMCTPPALPSNKETLISSSIGYPLKASISEISKGIGKWVVFKGENFDTEASARRAGELLGDALLFLGAVQHLGVDIGFSKTTLQFHKDIHEAVRAESGRELRGEVHGLMTYETDTVRIIGIQAHASTSIIPETFNPMIEAAIGKPLTERQRNCASLINDSFFVPNLEGQFVLRISAAEALCDQNNIEADYQSTIDWLLKSLESYSVGEATRTSVKAILKNARRKSVRQSYLQKFSELLSDKDAADFDRLYKLRSKLLHEGIGRGTLAEASNSALRLVTKLLDVEIHKTALT